MQPLNSQVIRRRKELTSQLDSLATQLSHLEATGKHLETARRRCWETTGQLRIIDRIKLIPSLDGLMKKRLEQKMTAKTAQATADSRLSPHLEARKVFTQQLEHLHSCRGALEEVERLSAKSESVTLMMAGQVELLRKKWSQLESKASQAERESSKLEEAYQTSRKTQLYAEAGLAVISTLISRHVSSQAMGQHPDDGTSPTVSPGAILKLTNEKRAALEAAESVLARREE